MWYEEQADNQGNEGRTDAAVMPIQRVLRGFLLFISMIIILDHFGINVTALIAALGIDGLALSLLPLIGVPLAAWLIGIILMLTGQVREGIL